MNIQSLYDIGDEVYFIGDRSIYKSRICEISIGVKENIDTTIYYRLDNGYYINEGDLFNSLEELKSNIENLIS